TAWTCTTVDNDTDNTGDTTSLAFNPSGTPYISYYDTTATSLMVAQYDGDAVASGCGASGSSAWTCTTVDNDTDGTGSDSSIAFNPSGIPYISYHDISATSLMVAYYDGDAVASGCGASGSSAWTCTTVDNTSASGYNSSLSFDASGNAAVSHWVNEDKLQITQYKSNIVKPTYTTTNTPSSSNAIRSSGRFTLSNGKPSASTSTTCTGVSNFFGLCGISQEDGQYDSIVAAPYERPMYMMKARFNNNTTLPTLTWAGNTTEAPTGNSIKLQIYRYGTTNAWEDVATFSSTCADACVLSGMASGTVSEYFEADGSNYNVYFRVYQVEDATNSITFKTDVLKAVQQSTQMRHGRTFNRDLLKPFDTEQR
ncbi:MAG: hypothetical protein M3Q36_01545, partial [bacterium]|nr:hypothetical protein [bacterium]